MEDGTFYDRAVVLTIRMALTKIKLLPLSQTVFWN